MADEVIVSTNPTINSPEILSAEAIRPVNLLERMEEEARRVNVAQPAEQPKGRGRPRGSKNRTTMEREQSVTGRVNPGQRMIAPPPRIAPPTPKDERTPEQIQADNAKKRILKEQRVTELTEKICEAANENIMLLLTSMDVPSRFLYKKGREPKQVAESSAYTDFGGKVTVKPMQANLVAHFVYELEQTEQGQKFTGATAGSSKAGLLIYGLLSLAAVGQYVKGLSEFTKELGPMMAQAKALQAQMEESRRRAEEQSNG